VLALAATWIAALARVPQQRAAVERLLRAQTGLDVRYGRLVVRLGFYGPEAEFSNIEMHRPGADAPLLRAPRMVARFESWRLLRGGQLRPGRVLVSGAEIDLRQLSGLRRGRAAAVDAPVAPTAAPALLTTLETWLPSLLAGIPEGSLDFEAVTLVWIDPARPAEPLQLRAPRLYASRRVDGAQLSGTLLLPARFGRTLFVALQLRGEPRSGGGGARDGRLRLSGRGLVLASWRAFGLLPDALLGGTGDVALTVQLRGGASAAGRWRSADRGARLRRAGPGGRAALRRRCRRVRFRAHRCRWAALAAAAGRAGTGRRRRSAFRGPRHAGAGTAQPRWRGHAAPAPPARGGRGAARRRRRSRRVARVGGACGSRPARSPSSSRAGLRRRPRA
jgi:hypothetical protein